MESLLIASKRDGLCWKNYSGCESEQEFRGCFGRRILYAVYVDVREYVFAVRAEVTKQELFDELDRALFFGESGETTVDDIMLVGASKVINLIF